MPPIPPLFRKPFNQAAVTQAAPVTNNNDKFLTAEQSAAKLNGDSSSMTQADDAALLEAIQASLVELNTVVDDKQAQAHIYFADSRQTGGEKNDVDPRPVKEDFLTKAQIFAMETGEAETIRLANEDALAMGIRISAEEIQLAKPMRSGTNLRSIPEDEYTGQLKANEKLRKWFTAHDLQVVPNSGTNNNCLLISLLQHASGNYRSEHLEEAKHYKAILASLSGGDIWLSDSLFEDTHLMARLIDQINQDYESDIRAEFYVGTSSDEPGVRTTGTGTRPVIIFNQVGHFEAVIPVTK